MPLRSGNVIGTVLKDLPSEAIKHITILQCAKLALFESAKAEKECQPEAACGADDAAMAILTQLIGQDPIDLKLFGHTEGVVLKKRLFLPVKGLNLDPAQRSVYQAALDTAEIQMRSLYDSNYKYPKEFGRD